MTTSSVDKPYVCIVSILATTFPFHADCQLLALSSSAGHAVIHVQALVRKNCIRRKNAAQTQQPLTAQSLAFLSSLCKPTKPPAFLTSIKTPNGDLTAWVMLLLKHPSCGQLPSLQPIVCLLLLGWDHGLLCIDPAQANLKLNCLLAAAT